MAQLPCEVHEIIVSFIEPAALLALACASQAAWQYLSHSKWSVRRQEAQLAVASALEFICLEHEADWERYGIKGPKDDSEESEDDSEDGTTKKWLPGPRVQGCDSLAAMFRCQALNLAGHGHSGGRGYQCTPRGCHRNKLMGGFSQGGYGTDFAGQFSIPRALCTALPSLTELDLKDNKISALPSNFDCLRSLKKLDLTCNSFEVIPPVLSVCPHHPRGIGNGQLLPSARRDRPGPAPSAA